MRDNGRAIGRAIGPGCCLVEFGSGSSVKTRLLLDHLDETEAADGIQAAIMKVLADGEVRTKDMGGTSTTREIGEAVEKELLAL